MFSFQTIKQALSPQADRRKSQLPSDAPRESQKETDDEVDLEGLNSTRRLSGAKQAPPARVSDKARVKASRGDLSMWARWRAWFTVYRQLFAVSLGVNVALLVLAVTGHFEWGVQEAGTLATLTFMFSVLTRNEICMRAVFWVTVHVMHRRVMPKWARLEAAYILHHIGGVHSGSAVASVMWLTYHLARRLSADCPHGACYTVHSFQGVETILLTALLAILTAACLGAHPAIRRTHHNVFEISHRALGWKGLIVLWTADLMGRKQRAEDNGHNITHHVVDDPGFWVQTLATALVILPWLCVRKRDVTSVISPLEDNIVIRFTDQGVGAGLFTRISRSPLREWHTFAAVAKPEGKEAGEHLIIVSGVGDFTKALIANPPAQLWTRWFRFADLPYVLKMFTRFTLVATGAGIAPLVSCLTQAEPDQVINCVWSVRNPATVLPTEVFDMIMAPRPNQDVRMWNTEEQGRADLVALTREAVKDNGSEIVVVISNPGGTRKMLDGMAAAGIPCLGPILDS